MDAVKAIIGLAERYNVSPHSSITDLMRIADDLNMSYGNVSLIWEENRIGDLISGKCAVREREKKRQVKHNKKKCANCGAVLSDSRATYCKPCALDMLHMHKRELYLKRKEA